MASKQKKGMFEISRKLFKIKENFIVNSVPTIDGLTTNPLWNWAPSQYEDDLPRHENFYHEDKTVTRPSYLYNGNPYTGKTTSLYWNGPWSQWADEISQDVCKNHLWFHNPLRVNCQNFWESNISDLQHDDVIKWKHFLSYWPFVGGIPRTKASDGELWCFLWSASE